MKLVPKLKCAVGVVGVLLFTAGAQAAVDLKAEEERIRALNAQFAVTAAKRDLDGQVAAYAADAVMMPPDRAAIRGIEAIRRNTAEFLKLPSLVLKLVPEKIEVSPAGDYAVDMGRLELEFDGPQGRVKTVSKYLQVWRKRNGAWQIAYDMWNAEPESER